ncbi:hypothetical protein ACJO1Z_22830 [Vibrio parahaemolyticus]|uniref:hypothetical protein n=1 Tax=Vibrio parahaemolyticus TaxID=670 RepID=UPI00387AB3CE
MNDELLTELKKLQKTRGDLSAFSSHDDFLPWSDEIPPLLEFDESLCKKFVFWADHVKSAYRMGRSHHDALGECIGVVNQAIKKLEIRASSNIELYQTEPDSDLCYPDKITLKWLYQHVPWSMWVGFIGVLITTFSLGIAFSETELYNSLKPSSEISNVKTKT